MANILKGQFFLHQLMWDTSFSIKMQDYPTFCRVAGNLKYEHYILVGVWAAISVLLTLKSRENVTFEGNVTCTLFSSRKPLLSQACLTIRLQEVIVSLSYPIFKKIHISIWDPSSLQVFIHLPMLHGTQGQSLMWVFSAVL